MNSITADNGAEFSRLAEVFDLISIMPLIFLSGYVIMFRLIT